MERYSRQILFSAIGKKGQERVIQSRVAVIGCGALGTVSAEMLVRAGVGHVQIIDRDFVETSNLQRQSLFTETDARAGLPKAVAAENVLSQVNGTVNVQGIVEDITFENIDRIVQGTDVIVDGTDNFESRFLINDYCVQKRIPWIYGAAVGSYGLSWAIEPGKSPCLRCLFPEPPPVGSSETCETAGIIAPVIHVVSAYQITETLRLLVGEPVSCQMLQVDVWNKDWRTIRLGSPATSCPCCGAESFEFLQGTEKSRLTRLCGRNAVQVYPRRPGKLDLPALTKKLGESVKVTANEYLLRAQIGDCELALFFDGRAIIKGTDDYALARSLYSRYVGD